MIKNVPQIPVHDVVIGVFSTLVKTEMNCGIASTIKYGSPHQRIKDSGQLEELTLRELAEYVFSENLLEASVGMAAINSMFPIDDSHYRQVNASDIIVEKGQGRTLGIIGHFPFLERLKGQFKQVYIFEKQPQKGDLGEKDIPEYLPEVDIVAITGTTITNHTFEDILKWSSKDAVKIVLGPSTPLSPVLFDMGIDVIAGSVVRDYEITRQQVLQATPSRYLEGLEFATLFREDYC
ncbi:DUF364 domain-containing protein [bacterium]|nr:DUF364 domain-containing protein [bacterium]MBU1633679.1 DUF364 domain-containing protein [bacterium]MBU1875006.1 DUF364 domain-containing protein [bacterium]